jgi:hypothetical protein
MPAVYTPDLGLIVIFCLQLAGRASVSLHTNIFFKDRVVTESALVMRLKANGCVVLVPRYGIEGTIFLVPPSSTASKAAAADAAPARALAFDEVAQTLTDVSPGADSARLTLRVFDEIKVAIQVCGAARCTWSTRTFFDRIFVITGGGTWPARAAGAHLPHCGPAIPAAG